MTYTATTIAARRTLLDALQALEAQRDALVLVGAQAVYLYTGEADVPIATQTKDSDLAVIPADRHQRRAPLAARPHRRSDGAHPDDGRTHRAERRRPAARRGGDVGAGAGAARSVLRARRNISF